MKQILGYFAIFLVIVIAIPPTFESYYGITRNYFNVRIAEADYDRPFFQNFLPRGWSTSGALFMFSPWGSGKTAARMELEKHIDYKHHLVIKSYKMEVENHFLMFIDFYRRRIAPLSKNKDEGRSDIIINNWEDRDFENFLLTRFVETFLSQYGRAKIPDAPTFDYTKEVISILCLYSMNSQIDSLETFLNSFLGNTGFLSKGLKLDASFIQGDQGRKAHWQDIVDDAALLRLTLPEERLQLLFGVLHYKQWRYSKMAEQPTNNLQILQKFMEDKYHVIPYFLIDSLDENEVFINEPLGKGYQAIKTFVNSIWTCQTLIMSGKFKISFFSHINPEVPENFRQDKIFLVTPTWNQKTLMDYGEFLFDDMRLQGSCFLFYFNCPQAVLPSLRDFLRYNATQDMLSVLFVPRHLHIFMQHLLPTLRQPFLPTVEDIELALKASEQARTATKVDPNQNFNPPISKEEL